MGTAAYLFGHVASSPHGSRCRCGVTVAVNTIFVQIAKLKSPRRSRVAGNGLCLAAAETLVQNTRFTQGLWICTFRLYCAYLILGEARLRQGLQSPNLSVQTILRQRGHSLAIQLSLE
jgi:hypothetical protein